MACVVFVGCAAGAFPRPAEIPAPGRFTFTIHQVAATVVPAASTVTEAGGVGMTENRTGNAGLPIGLQGSMVAWGPLVGIESRLAAGLFRSCEGAVLFGLSRVAAEMRCGLLGAERGPPVALSGAFGYMPFFSRDGWWVRLQVDIATPRAPWQLLLGPALTVGPQAYALPTGVEGDFSLPGDADGPYAQMRQNELRLSIAIGVAYSGATSEPILQIDGLELRGFRGTTWILGIVPFVTLAARDIRRECVGCVGAEVGRFDGGWGASVVVGVQRFDPTGEASPFPPTRVRIE